jgi:hypothetical protein
MSEYTIYVPEPDSEMPVGARGMWHDARDDTAWGGALVRRAVRYAKAQALREAADECGYHPDDILIADWLRERADRIERGET